MHKIIKCFISISFLLLLLSCSQDNNVQTERSSDKSKEKTVQFLVIGVDSRGEASSRSDAMLIVQYSKNNKSLKIASLMRDSYVKIPTYEKGYNKLNMAYFLGGEELLVKTIEENFKISVDHTITIDFEGFAYIVDVVAPNGIEVEVSEAMIKDMNFQMKPGKNKLHGNDLLKYVRFRHDENSDFGRVARQQEVVMKVKDAFLKDMNTTEQLFMLPNIMEGAEKYVSSDISFTESLSFISLLVANSVEKVSTITIPMQNSFKDNSYDHAGAVLELDIGKNQEALKEFFDPPIEVNTK